MVFEEGNIKKIFCRAKEEHVLLGLIQLSSLLHSPKPSMPKMVLLRMQATATNVLLTWQSTSPTQDIE